MSNSNGVRSDRLERLLLRTKADKAAIAEERVRLQKQREKEAARLALLIGTALVRQAEKAADLRTMLIHVLRTADLDEPARKFLAQKEWL